jgi:hypothetical protein
MRTRPRTITALLASFALAAVALSAQAQSTSKATSAPHSKSKASPTLMATGQIASFDSTSRQLTISTKTGDQLFMLGSSVRISEGKKTIPADSLATLAHRSVKVRYQQSGDQKTVESVSVSPAQQAHKS